VCLDLLSSYKGDGDSFFVTYHALLCAEILHGYVCLFNNKHVSVFHIFKPSSLFN